MFTEQDNSCFQPWRQIVIETMSETAVDLNILLNPKVCLVYLIKQMQFTSPFLAETKDKSIVSEYPQYELTDYKKSENHTDRKWDRTHRCTGIAIKPLEEACIMWTTTQK